MPTTWSISSRRGPSCCASLGLTYKDMEDQGFLLVVTKVEVRFRRPASYDDLLTMRTTVAKTTMVRIDHRYEVLCEGQLLAEGSSTLACVDRDGRPQALPEFLRERRSRNEGVASCAAS